VCDEFWLVGRGGIAPFDGDLDDYQRYLLDEANASAKKAGGAAPAAKAAAPAAAVEEKKPVPRETPEQRKLDAQRRQQQAEATKPLRKEIEKIDLRMKALSTEQASLQALLGTTTAPAELAQAGKRLKAIEGEIGMLEERWLELSEQIETAAV
jgi:ATP-binding cassette subfamily F protein 3